jgi:hypothetical protein
MSASPLPPSSPRSARAAAASAASAGKPSGALAKCCVATALWSVLLLCVAFIVWVAAVLFAGVAYGGSVSSVGWSPVAASAADDRAFAYVQLDNGLQVLLISDPDATTSAAALNVQAGSWHDPAAWPGLAHAVEHCLFLGTLKYPGEDEYGARQELAQLLSPAARRARRPRHCAALALCLRFSASCRRVPRGQRRRVQRVYGRGRHQLLFFGGVGRASRRAGPLRPVLYFADV